MKRLAPIALFAAVALTLAACGSNAADDGTPSSGTSGTSTASQSDTAGTDTGDADSSSAATDSGDTSTPADGGEPVSGGTFTMVTASDPGNLDPQMSVVSALLQFDQFLYDKLVAVADDGSLMPRLAEKWESTATEATFTLREGITCSDGTPLTATMVANNFNWAGNPENAAAVLGLFVPPAATATADDAARTVTVTSPTPDPFLVDSVGGLYIVCQAGLDDRSLLAKGEAGTGMYTLQDSVPGDHYTLQRRTDYAWGAGADFDPAAPGRPDTVVIKVVENESTAANLLLSGDANLARIVGPDRDRVAATDAFHHDVEAPIGELWYNHKAGGPTADTAVRVALTQALDLDQLRAVITGGTGTPVTQLTMAGSPCTADTVTGHIPAHDVAAASAALAAAGPVALTLYYSSELGPNMQATAELLQALWGEVGVTVTVKPMTAGELSQIVIGGQGQWDVTLLPVGIPLPTQLVPFVSGATAPNGQNFASIANPDYDAAVAKAVAQVGTAGCGDWGAAESALVGAADVVPFANSTVPIFSIGATFGMDQDQVEPGSIRMTA